MMVLSRHTTTYRSVITQRHQHRSTIGRSSPSPPPNFRRSFLSAILLILAFSGSLTNVVTWAATAVLQLRIS